LWLDHLPRSAAVDRADDVASFAHRNAMKPIEEPGAVRPSLCRDRALGPGVSTVNRVVKSVAANSPALQRIEELNHLKVEAGDRSLELPALASITGAKDLTVEIDRPAIEQVGEKDGAHSGITRRRDSGPMQPAIDGVIIDRAVAARPTVKRIEEEKVVNAAKRVVPYPGLSSVGRMKEGVAGSPSVQ